MKAEGFTTFNMQDHTDLWHAKNAKYQYGAQVEGPWYWYESWVAEALRGERRTVQACRATRPDVLFLNVA